MVKGAQYWLLVVLGAICVVLVIANMFLFEGNSTRQTKANERAQYIQQSVQLQSLYQEIVRGLAELSVRNKDPQLQDLLSKQGISVTVNSPAGAGTVAINPKSSASALSKGRPQ